MYYVATETREFRFPEELSLLEEINLPTELAVTLLGKTIPVEVTLEALERTHKIEGPNYRWLTDPDGTSWNSYSPMLVSFRDSEGKAWRIPRHWVNGDAPVENHVCYNVTREYVFSEFMVFPTSWDLAEINLPPNKCIMRGGQAYDNFEIKISPNQPVRVSWAGYNPPWRIPRTWRRRRIRLPEADVLIAQGVPPEVSAKFSGQIVTVNYHPGTLCCLPTQYRFRDGCDGPWAVNIADCVIVGYGDTEEKFV